VIAGKASRNSVGRMDRVQVFNIFLLRMYIDGLPWRVGFIALVRLWLTI
jgi:hypothetical protein